MELFTPWHLIIVAGLAVLLFYRGNQLPDMARSVGRSLRVFKTEIKGLTDDDKAREAAKNDTDAETEAAYHGAVPAADDSAAGPVNVTKAIEVPKAIDAPAAAQTPRVVAAPSEPIPVRAEVIREPAARPRPRPAGSASRP